MKRIVSCVLALTMVLSLTCFFVLADNENGSSKKQLNRYNVVLVTDSSGSMKDNDPDGYRFEAIELFVSLLANGGNRVGAVVFGTGVLATHDLVEVNGRTEKNSIIDTVRSQKASGWTDTGAALCKAIEMLDADADPSLPSIIILLTDGITEMPDTERTAESLSLKEDALEAARDKKYQIYTISLNCENSANSSEMQQIAYATGGECREVNDASDLQSVFDVYYQMIYDTQSIQLVDETIPESGVISRDFTVVELGVEEVNVVIFGSVDKCSLKKPDDVYIEQQELDSFVYSAKTFTLIKIANPENGIWNLTVEAEPDSSIKIFKIYNANLGINCSLTDEQESYKLDDDICFVTQLTENGESITDTSRYLGYSAELIVTNYQGDTVYSEIVNTATSKGFEHVFKPQNYGTYYAKISVKNEELYAESEVFSINVGNTAPIAVNEKPVKWHIYRWPFLFKSNTTIDLNGNAKDAEDENLEYVIRTSTWLTDDYTINGSELTINNFSVSKGSFTIEAYDSLGAYCTFELKVTSTNVGLWVVILILIGIVLTLAILGFIAYKSLGIPFMGAFTVENISTGESATKQKSRGRLKLSSFQIGQTGIDRAVGAYFQATGKSYVYLKSSKPLYSDYSLKKSKKIKIESSVDIRVSTSPDFENGVIIRFESMLNNNLYF